MLRSIKDLLLSFKYAGRGVCAGIKHERNMRIHIVAVIYVTLFGILGGISRGSWLAICLCFGLVISAELVNTAIEKLCDVVTKDFLPAIGLVKDISAAAVLICALCAVAVAAFVFSDAVVIENIRLSFTGGIWKIIAIAISVPVAALFVFRKRS